MVKFKIQNTDYEAHEGMTILEVAEREGFKIPTLCHKKGLPHYSSCMVCLVKDKKTNNFLPSCSSLVQEGMELDLTGEEVVDLRKKAIELLLSEHRAECEAPCKVVCPAGYNIPLMNRLIAERDFEAAIELSLAQLNTTGIMCDNCPGYCENACRRKKADNPVSIRNIQLFIFKSLKNQNHENNEVDFSPNKAAELVRRFSSRIGKLEEFELKEWLKECSGNEMRFREIADNDSAASEAESCMHCDCRAADDCRLRDLAEEFSIKDPRGKIVNSPIVKKINRQTGLIFENAKCIKCGLCVRLCENFDDEPALCFINRGFVSIISEPITEKFENILNTRAQEVIAICPTGALSKMK
jgi:ferredoxin